MSDIVEPIAAWCAAAIELIGIGVILVMSLYALWLAVLSVFRKSGEEPTFLTVRIRLGRGILLGLEFLIAADIIHTVAIELTFTSVGVLAIIVLIRTFLSFALEIELTGHLPWQAKERGRTLGRG
ncbi:hypothetical protein CAI21_18905 [Alkalilimnicola ehrlichii]|uniref:DUF1622 domain-containing protein n=1 Tax=Alkalilimnicola ehrlichii TaxID=351052 RepID=A0A3E0WKH6_9GAMM|nr:DUF1622 domain-containing protein [Alkalilimnicola ehrlichii]RFA25594.1 hypothetical protein CAI21_18905 [Alkalilimnicola ehrlichii]RFA32723.1 hypothetical protein CAL65_19170 [Alkalilimnicola ehrlichii]